MAPTATILFPETLADEATKLIPEVGGFDRVMRQGVSIIEFDNGAEQKRLRHQPLAAFRFRTPPLDPDLSRNLQLFLEQVGGGHVNFGFYEPEARFYKQTLVGLTDGDETVTTNYRNIEGYSDILVGGVSGLSGFLGITPNTGDLKIDILTFDSSQSAGLDVEIVDFRARRLYICRMTAFHDYIYAGGAIQATRYLDTDAAVPIFRRVFEFQFAEIGGY